MARRLERLFSVRKAGLSDGTSFSRSHAPVSGSVLVGENPRSAESISPESMLIDHADPTIPMVWEGTVMSGDSPFGAVDDDSDLLRPHAGRRYAGHQPPQGEQG
jgi:hypothetical protein